MKHVFLTFPGEYKQDSAGLTLPVESRRISDDGIRRLRTLSNEISNIITPDTSIVQSTGYSIHNQAAGVLGNNLNIPVKQDASYFLGDIEYARGDSFYWDDVTNSVGSLVDRINELAGDMKSLLLVTDKYMVNSLGSELVGNEYTTLDEIGAVYIPMDNTNLYEHILARNISVEKK